MYAISGLLCWMNMRYANVIIPSRPLPLVGVVN